MSVPQRELFKFGRRGEEEKVELIDFHYPKAGTKLRMPRIVWEGPESSLVDLLSTEFSKFGLLYQVTAKPGPDPGIFFAYVTFYSSKSASTARLRLNNNLVISGKAVKVRKSESNLKNHPLLEQPLSRDKCHDLANFYLGFNGWSTEVVYSRVEEIKENPNSIKYATAIRLTIGDFHVDGVGLCEQVQGGELGSKVQLMSYVRKTSLSAALRNAFSRIILVVVDCDKVTATIDTSVKEPFHYNPLWDQEDFLTVNEVQPTDDNDFVVDADFEEAAKDLELTND